MIIERNTTVVGKVEFEKSKLSVAFPKTRVSQLDIQEQLDTLKSSNTLDFITPKFILNVKKDGDVYSLTLTQPVTKKVTITKNDMSKLETMLSELATYCTDISLGESHSSTQLLNNESH